MPLMCMCEVEATVRLGRSTIYRYLGAGTFPRPVRLGTRTDRWRRDDIEAFIAARGEKA